MKRADFVLLAALFALTVAHAAHFNHTCDDAYVSFRYAAHLADGDGPVFNPGERVMGYSNPLWVLLLAAAHVFGLAGPAAAKLLGLSLSLATVARLYAFAKRAHGSRRTAVAACLVLVANGTFALWVGGGLEGPLLSFLLLSAVLGAQAIDERTPFRHSAAVGTYLGLAAITRPEGVIYAGAVGLWLVARHRSRGLRAAAVVCGIAGAFYGAMLAASYLYYGDPLPNTYHAKAVGLSQEVIERGVRIAWAFVRDYQFVPLAIALAWGWFADRPALVRGGLPLLVIGAFTLFFVAMGGDLLVYHRLWLSTLPMLALLAAGAHARIAQAGGPRRALVADGAALLLAAASLPTSFAGPRHEALREDDAFLGGLRQIAGALRQMPADTLVATNNVGILGYEGGTRILDMLGLTDRHIATSPNKDLTVPGHGSHDGRYVLDRAPDLIILGMPMVTTTADPTYPRNVSLYPSDLDLLADPRFQRDYELVQLKLDHEKIAPVYRRRRGE